MVIISLMGSPISALFRGSGFMLKAVFLLLYCYYYKYYYCYYSILLLPLCVQGLGFRHSGSRFKAEGWFKDLGPSHGV